MDSGRDASWSNACCYFAVKQQAAGSVRERNKGECNECDDHF